LGLIPLAENNVDSKSMYEEYFALIDEYFGSILHHLGDDDTSHIDFGNAFSKYPIVSDLIIDSVESISEDIDSFWDKHAKIKYNDISNQDSLKCLFSGRLTPSILSQFVKKSGLYVDTIILPDPIFNLSEFRDQSGRAGEFWLYQLLKSVSNMWNMKGLFEADLEIPIVEIIPVNVGLIPDLSVAKLYETAKGQTNRYLSQLFDQPVESADDRDKIIKMISSFESIPGLIPDRAEAPEEYRNPEDMKEIFKSLGDTWSQHVAGNITPGDLFLLQIEGQFIRAEEHKYFCEYMNAEPIYDLELPWHFFNMSSPRIDLDTAISNVLVKEQFDWVTNISTESLVRLREEHELEYMRQVLRRGITSLKARKKGNLLSVAEEVETNFQEALSQQAAEKQQIQEKINTFEKRDVVAWGVSNLAGLIGGVGFLNLPFLFRDIKKLLQTKKDLLHEQEEIEDRFINILLEAKDHE
jgi:hypothetical protein